MRLRALVVLSALSTAGAAAPLPHDAQAQRYYYEEIFEPFFAIDRPAGVYRSQRPESVPSSFPVLKSTTTFRVFLVGGSIAAMALEDATVRTIQDALDSALPSKKVEVINCGMSGYDSFREALVEQEILEYAPDLIVLMTGHNESMGTPPIPLWVLRAQGLLSRWSAYRALAKTLQARLSSGPRDAGESRRRDAVFEANLRENIRQAVRRGVAVAVLVPPVNYRDGLTSQPAPTLNLGFMRGRLAYLRGDCAQAQQSWEEALPSMGDWPSLESNRPLTLFYQARCEERLGRLDAARRSYERAMREDAMTNRCGPPCQEIIRRAAREEGAIVVESDRTFREKALPRLPGLDLFDDSLHWKPRYNAWVSLDVVTALRRHPRLSALPWDERGLVALRKTWETPLDPPRRVDGQSTLRHALREIAAGENQRISHRALIKLESVHALHPEWFRDIPELMRQAQRQQDDPLFWMMPAPRPLAPMLHWYLGEMRLVLGEYRAAQTQLASAVSADPSLSGARLSLALAQGLSGDVAQARKTLTGAVDAAPASASGQVRREAEVLAQAAGWDARPVAAQTEPQLLKRLRFYNAINVYLKEDPNPCAKLVPLDSLAAAAQCKAYFFGLNGGADACIKLSEHAALCQDAAAFAEACRAQTPALCGPSDRCRLLMGEDNHERAPAPKSSTVP